MEEFAGMLLYDADELVHMFWKGHEQQIIDEAHRV